MYALNVEQYNRWLSMPNHSQRFWISVWIDSLHVGTPAHWQASPVSVLSLAYLWTYMAQQDPRYTRRQLASIKAMARRRQNDPATRGRMPAYADADGAWSQFFTQQVGAGDEIRRQLLEWNISMLRRGSAPEPLLFFFGLCSLYSALLIAGYRSDQLFRSVSKGVLDPQGLRATSPAENLEALLAEWKSPSAREFIAYTRIVPIFRESVSNALLKKWTNLTLASVEEFNDPRTLPVLIGEADPVPYIVTRRSVPAGIAELHRREAIRVYSLRLQLHPQLSVFVFPHRSYFKTTEPGAKEQYYDVSFRRTEVAIESLPEDDTGTVLLQRSLSDLFDFPEEAIRNLLVAAELRWRRATVGETDQLLANAYRWALRRRLTADLSSYLSRACALGKDRRIPEMSSYRIMASWAEGRAKDYPHLLRRLAQDGDEAKDVVPFRLRELSDWYPEKPRQTNELCGLAHTFRECEDLLTIARGVRNGSTHFAQTDTALYGVMLHLARLVLEAYTARWARDATTGQ